MKKCNCKCGDCRTLFTITFRKSVPPWSLTCPVCGSKILKVEWCENEES